MATTPNSPAASSRPSSTSVSRAVSPQPRRSSPAPLRLSPAAAAVSPVASRGVGGINKTTSPPPTPSPLSASHTFADLAAAIHPPFAHVVSPSHSVSSLSRAQQVTKGGASSTKPGLVRSQTEPASPRKLAKTQSSGLGGARDPEKLQRGGRSVRSVVSQVQHDPNEGATLVLEKYSLYETKTKFYIVASNQADLRYRVLKIDRTPPPERVKRRRDEKAAAGDDDDGFEGLNVVEDATIYSKDELQELLETLQAGNVGGITRTEANFYGFAGFVRFTSTYYMILIKSRVPVALIGGHYIYHCEDTMLKAITPGASSTRSAEEAKQKAAFMGVDLSKNFYFSYTYDVTHTLQHNLTTPIASAEAGDRTAFSAFNDKWMWNRHLLEPAFHRVRAKSPWVLPLIHGFVDQAKLSVYGRTVYITLIARRSRHFAGARFLKRGVNSEGYVANDVETEQIVSEALTTSFHYPTSDDGGERRRPNPRYTSFVQVRGSIPLFWSQESVNMSPKPPIELTVVDPFFAAAARHFDDLFGRYGGPITVLNLIKHHERQPRESKLLPEFKQCIDYLNQFLPAEQTIKYIAWDISADNKGNEKDVIGILDDIAEEAIESTNFFHTGPEPSWYALNTDPSLPAYRSTPLLQSGVIRTNCIDCLDRTNAAQFVIAKTALAHQLHALGIIHHPRLPFDSDAVDIMTEMFHDHGDTVALQYGGSHLVNTMATYRKIGAWTSHSRDMIENLRRYYTNSFIDGDKQAAIDLFLGIDSLASSIGISDRPLQRRSYRDWFTSTHLQRTIDPVRAAELLAETGSADGNYWQAYYRPKLFTEFSRHFAYKVNSTLKYNSTQTFAEDKDHSPFIPRRKEREKATSGNAPPSVRNNTGVAGGVRRWMSHRSATRSKLLPSQTQRSRTQSQKVDDAALAALNAASLAPPTTTEGLVARLLNPTLPADELAEYESYIDQFSHLSLSQDLSDKDAQLYKSSTGLAAGGGGGGGNGEGGGLSVDRASQALYVEACKIARPGQNLKGFAGAGAGQSSSHGDAEDRL